MKTRVLAIVGCMLLIASGSFILAQASGETENTSAKSVNLLYTSDLSALAQELIQAYQASSPAVEIGSVEAMPGDILTSGGIGLVKAGDAEGTGVVPGWRMLVGRQVVVPVIHRDNPFLQEICAQGISASALSLAVNNAGKDNWGALLQGIQAAPLHIYIQEGDDFRNMLTGFLGDGSNLASMRTGSAEEVIGWVQDDPQAIGFCNAISVQGEGEFGLQPGIRLLPIDKNGNGSIDPVEDIYSDIAQFQRGVWIGKYPRTLSANVYAVSATQPETPEMQAFLKWLMAEGQQQIVQQGYCGLMSIESQANLARIEPVAALLNEDRKASSLPIILAVILFLGLAVGFGLRAFARTGAPIRLAAAQAGPYAHGPLDESSVQAPEGLYYDNTHTWAFREKNGLVSVGLDDFMQRLVGPITRVQMKGPGETVKKGELLFSIVQSGKQLSFYSPLSGTIRKQNELLNQRSSVLNESPYAEGWVYQIEPSNWVTEVQWLKMAEKYRNWLTAEFTRVKDVLAATLKPSRLEHAYVALQDGGVLKDGLLTELGPEAWAEFQSSFIDTSK